MTIITRTNGQPFATEASARQQLAAKGLQDTHEVVPHEVVPHEGGYALAPINREDERVTLQPGDYISTEGMTEEQYHAVARAFMAAGADGSKGDFYHLKHDASYLGWDKRDDELWDCGYKSLGFTGRHLTIDQVLNATNATPQPKETTMTTDPITTLKQARQARDEAEKAYQEALEAVRHAMGDEFHLTDVGTDGPLVKGEDMSDPANWREGDVVECINDEPRYCHVGGLYIVSRGAEHQSLSIKADDDGDPGTPPLSSFRFHHRPK